MKVIREILRKILKSVFLLFIYSTAIAQQTPGFIQSAPIAVSAEGEHGEAGEDAATMRARAELSASQIKKTATTEESAPQEAKVVVKETPIMESEDTLVEKESQALAPFEEEKPEHEKQTKSDGKKIQFPKLSMKSQKRFFQLGYSFLNSSWSEIDAALEDSSKMTSLSFVQMLHERVSVAVGLDFIHPKEEKMTPEEVRVFQLHLRPELVWNADKVKFYSGLGFGIADYNVRKKISSNGARDIYDTYGSGTSFSLTPVTGVRFDFSQDTALDFNAFYALYLGSETSDFGGTGLGIRLQFKL